MTPPPHEQDPVEQWKKGPWLFKVYRGLHWNIFGKSEQTMNSCNQQPGPQITTNPPPKLIANAPENWWLQDDFPLGKFSIQGGYLTPPCFAQNLGDENFHRHNPLVTWPLLMGGNHLFFWGLNQAILDSFPIQSMGLVYLPILEWLIFMVNL